jgi:hypothetical protein
MRIVRSATSGQITQAPDPRILQLGLKMNFQLRKGTSRLRAEFVPSAFFLDRGDHQVPADGNDRPLGGVGRCVRP